MRLGAKLIRPFILFGIAGAAFAQTPQLVWQGEVDHQVVLRIRGNEVKAEVQRGAPLQRQQFQFANNLPSIPQTIRVEARQARGLVEMLEHPRAENNYTASVRIDDTLGGRDLYVLAFYWHPGDVTQETQPQRRYTYPGDTSRTDETQQISWSGRVQGEATIACRRDACAAVSGQGVAQERSSITRLLPERFVRLNLVDSQGRGNIRLVEQPNQRNNYTARVQIRDPGPGPGDYSFTLAWTPDGRANTRLSNEPERNTRPGMVWSGIVDQRARISIQRRRAWSSAVEGNPIENERVTFERAMPARGTLSPTIQVLRGRGQVEIVEQPSNRNGYRLVFEIRDADFGSDTYEVQVNW